MSSGLHVVACVCLCVPLPVQTSLRTLTLSGLPSVRASELAALQKVTETDIPQFRRIASKAVAFQPLKEVTPPLPAASLPSEGGEQRQS